MRNPVRLTVLVLIAAVCLILAIKFFQTDYDASVFYIPNLPCTPILDKEKRELSALLVTLGKNILELQQDFDSLSRTSYSLGYNLNRINDILKVIEHDTITTAKPVELSNAAPKKQEVCPEEFAGEDLGFGAPYYRLGMARVRCKNFVPINNLITLILYVPNEYSKPAMSISDMMYTVAREYPDVHVVLATQTTISQEIAKNISNMRISFENKVIEGKEGNMWEKLLSQVETPYVLVAPYISHFDDDIDLYRLVRVLSYRDDVAVAGGSYRNLTGHWDLGCRQASFDYWTAKYVAGYYRSFNECVVCDYLPGPFVAKTGWLKSLKFDTSLSEGVFHDLFWRMKYSKTPGNTAVVCPDVMFNIGPPQVPKEVLVNFASKHDIKKIINSDGTVRWYGCRRGLPYTNKTECSWPEGIATPPCDLWNLAEVVTFVMQACEEGEIVCEYLAGDVVGAVRFGSSQAWGKDAEINFHTKNFSAFNNLRAKFENAGFEFEASRDDLAGLGSFAISTKNWRVRMRGRDFLEVGEMLRKRELPTRIPMSGAWVRVPRNPGRLVRGHYLVQYFSDARYHGRKSYYSFETPAKCPKPQHSACLDRYAIGGNLQYLNQIP